MRVQRRFSRFLWLMLALHLAPRAHAGALSGRQADTEGRWASVVALGERCSGVLVHPFVIAYTAHCGDQFSFASFQVGDAVSVDWPIAYCVVHPDGGAATGLDFAFCILEFPTEFLAPAQPALALNARLGEDPADGVGVAYPQETAAPGPRWRYEFALSSLARELDWKLEPRYGAALCPGDSGGAWFVPMSRGKTVWGLAGILSYSLGEGCAPGPCWAADVRNLVGWITDKTSLRLDAVASAGGQGPPNSGDRRFDAGSASVIVAQQACRSSPRGIESRFESLHHKGSAGFLEVRVPRNRQEVREVTLRTPSALDFASKPPYRFQIGEGYYRVEVRDVGGTCRFVEGWVTAPMASATLLVREQYAGWELPLWTALGLLAVRGVRRSLENRRRQ